jgi:acetoin utilization protein AcuB
MLVKNWMSTPVITIDIDASMQEAMKLLRENNFRMLPVMKQGQLVGVVTDRDLKRASASDATSLEIHELLYLMNKIKVSGIMTPNPITIPHNYTVEETTQILLENRISGAPVVSAENDVIGVITQVDLSRLLISLTGVGKKGIQFAFRLEDRAGSIREVCDLIRSHGGRIISLLTSYDHVPAGYRKVYVRSYEIDRERLDQLLATLREKTSLLYMIDHREGTREIY